MLIHRADHSLQDLRARIFPSKRKKAREPATVSSVPEDVPSVPEAVPVQESEHSVPLIGRRKERSLSSLVVSTPKISVKSVLTGKRSKSVARKRESPIPVEEQIKKMDDYYESLSSPETLRKIAQTKRQVEVFKLEAFLPLPFSSFFWSFENDLLFL
jgi:E3 ubiquitin-protein ligase DRIP